MTYCVGMRLDAGLVFLSDSRTNAGVDQVSAVRKMSVFENPGERVLVLMTSGNLSISQSVRQLVGELTGSNGYTVWDAPNLFEAARVVGEAVRIVHARDAESLGKFGIDFNINLVLGGQVKGERCRLFHIYSAGNFIEAQSESPYFQIGEAKYGKPIIDRVITPASSLDAAAKCALISMDSTLRSNVSVGLPLDLLVYETDSLAVTRFVMVDEKNTYFQMIRSTWGQQLKAIFEGIDAPEWTAMSSHPSQPVRAPRPADLDGGKAPAAPQSFAQHFGGGQQ
ncbi:MAG TPA: peptidase [Pseudoduganella sp.]